MHIDPGLLVACLATSTVVGAAALLGSVSEKRGAWLAAAGSPMLALAWSAAGLPHLVATLCVIDAVVFIGLMTLSWRSPRTWPVMAAASQGTSLAVQAIRLFSPGMPPRTYLTALAAPGYVLLAILALGTLAAWRRRKSGLSS